MPVTSRVVFVAGATGYIGRHLIPQLLQRDHTVRALVRSGSESRLASGCTAVVGDALDASTFDRHIPPAETFVQLVGVPHPGPGKADQFRRIDGVSVAASVKAARGRNIRHFVYVSVAQPAPVMRAYQAVRAEGERMIRESGMHATILRPWYVLGPGHRWPLLLLPAYGILELIPSMREGARRLGLVTINQMIDALVASIENPSSGVRIIEVPEIRAGHLRNARG